MAFTFIQNPTSTANEIAFSNWTPIVGWTLYRDDTYFLTGKFYYKLTCKITTGNIPADVVDQGTLRQRPNGYSADVSAGRARAIFDVRDIVNSVLVDTVVDQNCIGVPFGSIHELGDNTYECTADTVPCQPIYSHNGDRDGNYQINKVIATGREWYSEDQFEAPSQAASISTASRWFIRATMPLTTPRGTDPYAFQNSEELKKFLPISTSLGGLGTDVQFLSDVQKQNWNNRISVIDDAVGARLTDEYINWVIHGDYHTVAFINTYFGGPNTWLDYIRVKIYDGAGLLLNSGDLLNRNSGTQLYGGSQPTAQTGDTLPDEMLLYFGCGPGNLSAQNIDTTLRLTAAGNKTWAYYSIKGYDQYDDGVTAKYWFVRQINDCKGFETVRLGWVNSKGAYDYYNFLKKSSKTLDVKKTHFETMLGTYNKSVYRYNDTDRGKSVNKVTSVQKQTIQTDWISEEDTILIENLIKSGNVFIIKNAFIEATQPVIVTDKSFKKKTVINDGIKIQYTIKIEFANPENTNN